MKSSLHQTPQPPTPATNHEGLANLNRAESWNAALGKPTLHGPPPKGLEKLFIPAESGALPEFSKIPSPRERCPFSGASRTWLLEHAELGHFKIIRVRKPGKLRGALFLHVPSLMAFLRSELEKQSGNQGVEGK